MVDMKPIRNFQFRNKREIFAAVGFRYDNPSSIDYRQFKDPESVKDMVFRLLTQENGADIISIRRVYLPQEEEPKTEDSQAKIMAIPIAYDGEIKSYQDAEGSD